MSDPKDDTKAETEEVKTPVPQEEPQAENDKPKVEKTTSGPNPFDWISTGTSWGASFVQSAKEKTLNTIELVKKDFNEMTDTVSKETTALASATAEQVKQQAQLFHKFVTTPDGEDPFDENKDETKTGDRPTTEDTPQEEQKPRTSSTDSGFGMGLFKSIVETVKSFGIEDTVEDEEKITEKIVIPQRKSVLGSFVLTQIQNDERTYLTAPSDSVDLYQEWLEDFKLGEYNGEINMLLGYNPKLREIYAKLVPAKVDNHTFWNRYFFKVYLAELDKEVEKNEKKVFDDLKVETDPAKIKPVKIAKNDSSSALSGGSPGEKDETWSMCSSTNAEIQEIDDVEDNGPRTPRPNDEETTEDWEKCEHKDTTEPQSS